MSMNLPKSGYRAELSRLDAATAWVVLTLLRLKERLENLFREKQIQAAEKYSCAFAGAFFVPLAGSDGFFRYSVYMRFLSVHVGERNCAWVFGAFFTMQLLGLVFGVEPSGFIWDQKTKVGWLMYRLVMLLGGVFIWFSLAGLLTSPGLPPPPICYLSAWTCFQCACAAFHLAYEIKAERDYRTLKAAIGTKQ